MQGLAPCSPGVLRLAWLTRLSRFRACLIISTTNDTILILIHQNIGPLPRMTCNSKCKREPPRGTREEGEY